MIISHEHKFIFIKTRKTAGSSLEKILFSRLGSKDICTGSPRDDTPRLNTDSDRGHMPWNDVSKIAGSNWKSYYKFTIERNPWDKVVSSYYWHQKIKAERFENMDFTQYVKTCELLPRDWALYSNMEEPVVDQIFKYESMGEMYDELNNRFGFDVTEEEYLGTRCKSGIRKTRDYKDIHTEESIECVKDLFVKEIDYMGYTYE